MLEKEKENHYTQWILSGELLSDDDIPLLLFFLKISPRMMLSEIKQSITGVYSHLNTKFYFFFQNKETL